MEDRLWVRNKNPNICLEHLSLLAVHRSNPLLSHVWLHQVEHLLIEQGLRTKTYSPRHIGGFTINEKGFVEFERDHFIYDTDPSISGDCCLHGDFYFCMGRRRSGVKYYIPLISGRIVLDRSKWIDPSKGLFFILNNFLGYFSRQGFGRVYPERNLELRFDPIEWVESIAGIYKIIEEADPRCDEGLNDCLSQLLKTELIKLYFEEVLDYFYLSFPGDKVGLAEASMRLEPMLSDEAVYDPWERILFCIQLELKFYKRFFELEHEKIKEEARKSEWYGKTPEEIKALKRIKNLECLEFFKSIRETNFKCPICSGIEFKFDDTSPSFSPDLPWVVICRTCGKSYKEDPRKK